MDNELVESLATAQVNELASGLNFPEGPAFAKDGSLWLVEMKGESLVCLKDGAIKRFRVGGNPNGIAFDKKGHIWFCDSGQNSIRCFDPLTEKTETKADKVEGEILNAPNDLAFDDHGNLLFSCPGESEEAPTGYVCVLKKNGKVKKVIEDKYYPNGLAFTGDGKFLFLAETHKHRIWKGAWDSNSCEWTDAAVYVETGGPIGPDGIALDDSENLHIAVFGSSQIKVGGKNGKIERVYQLPGTNPTNFAFDPSGKLGLVVTEADKGLLLSLPDVKSGGLIFY